MGILTKDEIFAAEDLEKEEVPVPEWGGHVIVRSLSGTERDALEAATGAGTKNRNFRNLRARIVAGTVVDDQDKPLFTEKDVIELGKKSAKALDRIADVAMRLSGIRKEDVEEQAEDLDVGQVDGSSSA